MDKTALISLHEELLLFIMEYRAMFTIGQHPNFLLRSSEDIAELEEGRWFYDNPEEGWVYLFLTKSGSKNPLENNIHFRINVNGNWAIGGFPHEGKLKEFGDRLYRFFLESGFLKLTIELDEEYYSIWMQDGYHIRLNEALDNFIDFIILYRQDEKREIPLPLINAEEFDESIKRIEQIRSKRGKVSSIRLSSFHIQNYQGIRDTTLYDLPVDAQWIFLTGENGFGKTSLLRAIALGFYDFPSTSEAKHLPKNKTSIKITYNRIYNKKVLQVFNVYGSSYFGQLLDALATYGPSRLEIQNEESHGTEAKNSTALYSLFETDGILKNIQAEMKFSYYDNKPKFEAICGMLQTLIPSLDRIHYEEKLRQIQYYEKATGEENNFGSVTYDQLASGIKSIIAMAGDIYLRLSEKQASLDDRILLRKDELHEPELPYGSYKPEELVGIVIIDELDLHLHPKWLRELPCLLSKVFPKVQFIASTHSPIPLLGAPEGSVFLKVKRTVEEGVQVERLAKLEKEIHTLLPNTILTSPIFDFDLWEGYTEAELEHIPTEDKYEEIAKNKEIEAHLKNLDPTIFPEDLFSNED